MVSQTQLRARTSIASIPRIKPQAPSLPSEPVTPTPQASPEQVREYQRALQAYESQKKVYDAYEATLAEYGQGYISSKFIKKFNLTRSEINRLQVLVEGDVLSLKEQEKKLRELNPNLKEVKIADKGIFYLDENNKWNVYYTDKPELNRPVDKPKPAVNTQSSAFVKPTEVQLGVGGLQSRANIRRGGLVLTPQIRTERLSKGEVRTLSSKDLSIEELQQRKREGKAPDTLFFLGESLSTKNIDTDTAGSTIISATEGVFARKTGKAVSSVVGLFDSGVSTKTYQIPKTGTTELDPVTGKPILYTTGTYLSNPTKEFGSLTESITRGGLSIVNFLPKESLFLGEMVTKESFDKGNVIKGISGGVKGFVEKRPIQTTVILTGGLGQLIAKTGLPSLVKKSYLVPKSVRERTLFEKELLKRAELIPKAQENVALIRKNIADIRNERLRVTGGDLGFRAANGKLTSERLSLLQNQVVSASAGAEISAKELGLIKDSGIISGKVKDVELLKGYDLQVGIINRQVLPRELTLMEGSLGDLARTVKLRNLNSGVLGELPTKPLRYASLSKSITTAEGTTQIGIIRKITSKGKMGKVIEIKSVQGTPKGDYYSLRTLRPITKNTKIPIEGFEPVKITNKGFIMSQPEIFKVSSRETLEGTRISVIKSEGGILKGRSRFITREEAKVLGDTLFTAEQAESLFAKVPVSTEISMTETLGRGTTKSFSKTKSGLTTNDEGKLFVSRTVRKGETTPIGTLSSSRVERVTPRRTLSSLQPPKNPKPRIIDRTIRGLEPSVTGEAPKVVVEQTVKTVTQPKVVLTPSKVVYGRIDVPSYVDMKSSGKSFIEPVTDMTNQEVLRSAGIIGLGRINVLNKELSVTDNINPVITTTFKDYQLVDKKESLILPNIRPKNNNKNISLLSAGIREEQRINERVEVALTPKQEIKQEQRQQLRNEPSQQLKQEQRLTFPTLTPTRITTIPTFDFDEPKTTTRIPRISAKSLFKVYVREKGKDVERGVFGTKMSAETRLKDILKSTLRASGFVTRAGEKVRLESFGEFTTSKNDSFRLVQKKNRRFGTKKETSQAQMFRVKKNKRFTL